MIGILNDIRGTIRTCRGWLIAAGLIAAVPSLAVPAHAQAAEALAQQSAPSADTASTRAAPVDGASAPPFAVKRLLLTIGANNGGPDRVSLRYAGTDAEAVSKVFRELGGVTEDDQQTLHDPTPGELLASIQTLAGRAERAREDHARVEMIIYYSGHSDEKGLLLRGDTLPYRELRAAVDALPGDVRVVILDSCASGALTRLKGGTHRPPFLFDVSAEMRGHAILTSASDDEAAQESDRIGASFFTHALVSGLRGAADATGDGRITLNEAYQFAFYETLARTEGTQSGTQHPAYDIQMAGSGDFVMTDLRGTSAGLLLAEDLNGRVRVRDEQGRLVVELVKPQGRRVELGLEPGGYRVIWDRDGRFYASEVALTEGDVTKVDGSRMKMIASEFTTVRGTSRLRSDGNGGDHWTQSDDDGYREATYRGSTWIPPQERVHKRLSVSLWPGLSTNGPDEIRTESEVSINLTLGRSYGVHGFELGYLGNWLLGDMHGAQIAGGVNIVEGAVDGAQFAGALNTSYGDARHFQAAGLANTVNGSMHGVQLAGLFNYARRDLAFGQASAWLNYAGSDLEGFQLASGVNVVRGSGRMVQMSAVANYVGGQFDGAQFGSIANVAESFRGLQYGMANVAGSASGAQIGIVNVGRSVTGTQIGLVNVADTVDGAPIGLINYVRHGQQRAQLWHTDTGDVQVGIKLGNHSVYSLLAFGTETLETNDRQYVGAGLGWETPLGGVLGRLLAGGEDDRALDRLFLTWDLLGYHILEDGNWGEGAHMLAASRLGAGYRVASRFSLIGGFCAHAYVSNRHDGTGLAHGTWADEYDEDEGIWVKVWPGYFVGVQF